MAKRGKPTKTKTPQRGGPGVKVVSEGGKLPVKKSAADFVKRRTEVERKDHQRPDGDAGAGPGGTGPDWKAVQP